LAALVSETEIITTTEEFELSVLVAETNRSDHTYDGIDHGGERIVAEVMLILCTNVRRLNIDLRRLKNA